jgi:enoyl-CoA hydratase/carnithine racemase
MATVTLRQSVRFNAMSLAMWQQLRAGFERINQDAALRCVVIRGEGAHFCAGGDIAEYPAFRFDADRLRVFHEETVWGALQAMLDCDVPLLAQIDGNCMGAGLEMASCCDIRIASVSARFGAPIARLGFPMAPRELDLVLRAAGATATREVLLEARVLEAERLHQLGFLSRCVPDVELAAAVQAAAQRIVALAPQAARMHKRMLRALLAGAPVATEAPHEQGRGHAVRRHALDVLVDNAYDYADTPEHREGIAAFLDKRKPRF